MSKKRKAVRIALSILAAIAIWLYVDLVRQPSVPMKVKDIPVEFAGESTTLADKGLMLLSGYDTTIDLTLKGPRRQLWQIDKDDIRIVVDTSTITEVGSQSLTYQVVYPDGVSKNSISVDWASAYRVTVTVGELYSTEVPIQCEVVGTPKKGFYAEEPILDIDKVLLHGQRDDLVNISYAKLTVDISGATRSVVQTVDVQLYDYDGNLVENSNIRTSASLIQAKVPVLTTKEVALAIEFEGVPGAAADSIVCDIAPKTVRLNGEADVLASIDKLVLATLHVDDLGLHQQNSYVVTPPDGTWLVNGNEVATADITLDGISETTLTVTDLSFTDLPAGLYAVVPEGGLTVRLWGLSEEIEAITAENLRATADMSTVTGQGSFTVPVTVTVSGFSDVTVRGTYELTLTITDTPPQTEPAVPAGGEDQTVPEVPET